MNVKNLILGLLATVTCAAVAGTKVIKNGDVLVFMGDSITQYGTGTGGYLPLVADGLKANGVNVTWYGAGFAGNKAVDMLDRFETDALSKNPNVVTILAGVNDCSNNWPVNTNSTPDHVAQMADLTLKAGAMPVLFSPTGGGQESFPQSIEDYSAAVKEIAQARAKHGVPYGTTHEAFKAYVKDPINPVIGYNDKGVALTATSDGLHMSVPGNRIIAIEMLKALGFDSEEELNKAYAAWNTIEPFWPIKVSVKITPDEYNAVKAAAVQAGKSFAEYHKDLFFAGVELLKKNPREVAETSGATVTFSTAVDVGYVTYDALLDCGRALRQNETQTKTAVGSLPTMVSSAVLAAIQALSPVSEADLPKEPSATINAAAFPKSITFACSGYTGTSTLSDFPVAVRLAAGTPSGFSYSDMADSSNGAELRFADASGRSLSYEIDSWNPNGASLVWVKIPSLTRATRFTMYYGAATSGTVDPRWTWAADYVGVWHMSENGGPVAEPVNGLTAVPVSKYKDKQVAGEGVFGNARVNSVPGVNSYSGSGMLEVADCTPLDVGSDFSFSGWVKMTATSNGDDFSRIVSRNYYNDNGVTVPDWELSIDGYTTLHGYSGSKTSVSGTMPSAQNTWVHITGVFDGTTLTTYANGVQVFSKTIAPVQDTNNKMVFGAFDKVRWSGHFIGLFDEFRLRDAVSSEDWIKAEYDQAGTTFLTSGGDIPEVEPVAAKPSVAVYVD